MKIKNDEEYFYLMNAVNDGPVIAPIIDHTISLYDTILFRAISLDPDSDTIFSLVENDPHGATINPAGIFEWTPAPPHIGQFEFTIHGADILDSQLYDVERFTITVLPRDLGIEAQTDEDTPVTVRVFEEASDRRIISVDNSILGKATHNRTTISFAPNTDYNGNVTLSFVSADNATVYDPVEVHITILPVNDRPVAVDDHINITKTKIVDILDNDYDIENDTIRIDRLYNVTGGTAQINQNNTVTFEPAAPTGSFDYTILDAGNAMSDSAHVRLTNMLDTPDMAKTLIYDDFDSLDGWERFATDYQFPNPPVYSPTHSLTLSQDGNPAPSAELSGQRVASIAGMTKTFPLVNYTSGDPLYLYIDYRASSNTAQRHYTNAVLDIDYDGTPNPLFYWLQFGGTMDTGWRTFFTGNIAQYLPAGHRSITVNMWYVTTDQDADQRLRVDNLYIDKVPRPSGGASGSVAPNHAMPYAALDLLSAQDAAILCDVMKNYESLESRVRQYMQDNDVNVQCADGSE